jgi:hypothetical protein
MDARLACSKVLELEEGVCRQFSRAGQADTREAIQALEQCAALRRDVSS